MDQVRGQHLPVAVAPGEAAVADERETLGGAFRQRAHALWHAGVRLRFLTAVAVGVLVLTTVLAFAVALPMPRVPVTSSGGHLATIGAPIYVLCVLLLSIAWSYLLTGVVHARWPVHLLGLVIYTLCFVEPLSALSMVPALLGIALVVLLATWVVGFSHRLLRRDRGLGLVLPGIHFGLALALYAACYVGSVASGSALLFGFATSIQLAALQFVLIPVVVLSGTDFSEWGEVGGTWLAEAAGRFGRGPEVIAIAACVAALLTIGDAVRQHGANALGQVFPLLVAAALGWALLGATRSLHRRRPVRVPFGALVLGALGFLVSLVAAYVVVAAGSLGSETTIAGVAVSRYQHRTEPVFSIESPSLWQVRDSSQPYPAVTFDGSAVGNGGRFTIASAPAGALGADAFAGWLGSAHSVSGRVEEGDPTPDGPWTVRALAVTAPDGSVQSGHAWTRDTGGRSWVLYGLSPAPDAGLNDPLYAGLARSWEPDLGPAGATTAVDTNALISVGAVPWVLALAGLLAFLALRPHARPGVATGALMIGLIAILYVTSQLGPILHSLQIPLRVDGLRETGLQSGIAAVTLAIAAAAMARRRLEAAAPILGLLLTLLVGLQVVSWVFALFDLKNNGFGLLQAALIAAALAWDVVMGGGAIAQGHGRWFPRHSRVLVYFGYDMLVAAAVLFFAALQDQVTGQVADTGFSADFWAQNGLLILGVPMLVCLFLVKLGRLRTPA